jgi:palmitoyltransferase
VGFHNYKFFYLFVFYAWLACLQVVVTMGEGFFAAFGVHSHNVRLSFSVLMGYVLALSLTVSLFGFVLLHTYLILRNVTTLEFQDMRKETPFNLGKKTLNAPI